MSTTTDSQSSNQFENAKAQEKIKKSDRSPCRKSRNDLQKLEQQLEVERREK